MLPIPNLDDKTFAQLIEDAKKQIPRYAPEWTDFNVHDPGITMLELLSWLAESQRYYLDQVRDDHIRKYLKLLGTAPAPSKPARAEITFVLGADLEMAGYSIEQPFEEAEGSESSVPSDNARLYAVPLLVPRGTPLMAGDIRFVTEQELHVTSAALVSIVTLAGSSIIDQTESAGHEGLSFKAFGDKAEAGSSLYLGFDQPIRPETPIPIAFRLSDDYPVPIAEQEEGEPFEVIPPVILEWEYLNESEGWSKLEVTSDETGMLMRAGRIVFLAPHDAGVKRLFPTAAVDCCWFRCTVKSEGYELVPRIDSIMLHTVPIVQLDYIADDYVGRSNGLSNQSFEVRDGGGIVSDPPMKLEVFETGKDGSYSWSGWTEWTRREDLDASGPDDSHYVFDPSSGTIRFGDGLYGKVPPAAGDSSIRISYYRTMGRQGNVSAGAINQFADHAGELAGKLSILQLLPASGGANAERVEDAVARSVKELRRLTRAVTDEDYEQLACKTPGLRVARAKALWSGDNAVTVVVVPYSDKPNPRPSTGFLDTVSRFLNRHRLLTTRVVVKAPQYVKVQANVLVTINSGHDGETVAAAVSSELARYLHPLNGGSHGTGWPFGRTVYLSELYALIDKVNGVDSVQRLQLFNTEGGGRIDDQGNFVMDSNALVYSDVHKVEVEQQLFGRPLQEGVGYVRT
ncbi:putative baseplate assembly protein [Paenibacillus sp. CCS19]|uniref:putative baseplate assembly protein n=1 Tax=Paenibacillus sp. CCS19 TaxID=3158387 RepID=UPI0025612C3A|nr:putative baseplate assembly protein [Paenibacillus cellulosilyticus]GMK40243.1 putative baseplate assembly protein [Paenibacillus cellulosilyticus]